MEMLNTGDLVAVLDETIKGIVVSVERDIVKIEDQDGFIRSYARNKLVLQKTNEAYRIHNDIYSKDHLVEKQKKNKVVFIKKDKADDFEIDLHIEELRDSHKELENFQIIQIQMNACRAFVRKALENKKKKIVLIHGKGEGVLKSEIHTYLTRLSNQYGVRLDFHDASFQRYGLGGATEIVFY